MTAPTASELEVVVPAYHAGQAELRAIANRSRVTIAVVGRRWGKTFFGINETVEACLERCARGIGRADAGWAAPSYRLADIAWAELDRYFHRLIRAANRAERYAELICGCRIWFLSADNPTSVRGRGFFRLTVDEGAWIARKAYEEALLPTLADSDGPLLTITTPAGRRGWVYEEFLRAAAKADGYGYLQRPSTDNPNPNIRRYIELRRRTMSRVAYEQEFLALFTEDAAALFRNIDGAIGGTLEAPLAEAAYIIGVDLGKAESMTAAYVIRLSGGPPFQVVAEETFAALDWTRQLERLKGLADRYHRAPLILDAGGVGAPILDLARSRGITARGVVITGGLRPSTEFGTVRRTDLLDALAVGIANGDIRIPPELGDPGAGLRTELEAFAIDIDDEGRTDYVCRSGHGDRVFGLALAWHSARLRTIGAGAFTGGRLTDTELEDLDRNAPPGRIRS